MPKIDTYEVSKLLSPAGTRFFDENRNVLFSKIKDKSNDPIEVEIGDSKDPVFQPQAKMMRWGNEVNTSIRYVDFEPGNPQIITDGKVTKYIKPKVEFHAYDLDPSEINEDGGLEIELLLKKNPGINKFDFSLQTKNLVFCRQPELTQEEIDAGNERPDNVIGSYAVFHAYRGVFNRDDGMDYKTGKAFHIFRPKITDANGNWIWGELNIDIDNNLLSITIDQNWLNNAAYPVLVDPTIGYTTKGASSSSVVNNEYYKAYAHIMQEKGTISSITQYIKNYANEQAKFTFFIYDESSSYPNALIAQTSEWTVTSGWDDWKTINTTTNPELTAGATYYIGNLTEEGATNQESYYYYYDTAIPSHGISYQTTDTAPASTFPAGGSENRTSRISIYFTYTASSATAGDKIYFGLAGTVSWTVPTGFNSLDVECWGGGGGGGAVSANGGGGGGGGAYAKKAGISVTAGNSYNIVVGASGIVESAGGDSYFDAGAAVLAKGGGAAVNNTAGSGGSSGSCVGDVVYSGGDGGDGNTTGDASGGGGGAAGPHGAGGNATDASANTPTAGATGDNGSGGAGGAAGSASAGGNGTDDINGGGGGGGGDNGQRGGFGGWPGGGGGGGETNSSTLYFGRGADGLVIVTLPTSGTNYNETYTEAIAPVDTIVKTGTRVLSDVTTLADTIVKTSSRTLSEVVTHTDAFLRSIGRVLSETATHVDTFVSASVFYRTYTEITTLTDTIIRTIGRTLSDAITHIDIIESSKVTIKTLTDAIAPVDTFVRSIGRTLSDTVTHVDTFISQSSFYRTLTETATAVDSIIRTIARTLSEAVTHVDTPELTKVTSKVLSDATAITDSILRTMSRTLTDTTTLVDSVLRSIGRTLTEAVTHTDSIIKTVSKTLSEAVTHVDSRIMTTATEWTKTLSETTTAVDSLLRGIFKVLTENITLHDRVIRFTKWFSRSAQNWYNKGANWYTKLTGSWRDPLQE